MEQNILDVIKNAEMFLVGIGDEFSPAVEEEGSDFLSMCRKSKFYEEVGEDHEIFGTYDTLRSLIGVRPYFVVTMNTDDLIYRSSLEDDLIVAPCGSMGKLQCKEHIVDAKGYDSFIKVTGKTDSDEFSAEGTVLFEPKILKVDGYWVDVKPEGNIVWGFTSK